MFGAEQYFCYLEEDDSCTVYEAGDPTPPGAMLIPIGPNGQQVSPPANVRQADRATVFQLGITNVLDEANVEINGNFLAGIVEGALFIVVEVKILKGLPAGTPLVRLVVDPKSETPEDDDEEQDEALTQTQDVPSIPFTQPTQVDSSPAYPRTSPSWNPRCTPRVDRPIRSKKRVRVLTVFFVCSDRVFCVY